MTKEQDDYLDDEIIEIENPDTNPEGDDENEGMDTDMQDPLVPQQNLWVTLGAGRSPSA